MRNYAKNVGRRTDTVPLTVTFGVLVRVTNPGRIEGYSARRSQLTGGAYRRVRRF